MNTPTVCTGSSLGLLFRQVRDAMWARMERELTQAGHDLSFSQYITIKKLADSSQGASELARAAELNPGAMTRLLDKLEARGLLVRNSDPADRRALVIELTEAGRRLWVDVNECGARVREQAMKDMDADEQAQLLGLLVRVRDNLTAYGT